MTEEIKAMNFLAEDVGKHVKQSKKRYQWTISLKGKIHIISLDFSFISGKVKVVVDRKTVLENELPANVSFQYPFTLEGFSLNCIQQGQNFELRINNKAFSHLYNQEKTKSQFKNYEDQIKDIKTDSSMFQNKTMKISIGGMNKKKEKASSDNWQAFSGGANFGFPNYFGDNQFNQTKTSSSTVKQKDNLLFEDQKKQYIIDFDEPPHQNQTKKQQQFDFFQDNTKSNMSPNQQHLINIKNEKRQQPNFDQLLGGMTLNQPTHKTKEVNLFDQPYEQPKQASSTIFQNQNMQFSTMQNLFATNMANQMTFPQQVPQNQPLPQNVNINGNLNFISLQQNQKYVNNNEYSTMQQLFQTNIAPVDMQNMSVTHTQQVNQKKQIFIDPNNSDDIFKQMGIQMSPSKQVSMSTMGAGMNNFQQVPNTHNFGTMQIDYSKKNNNDLL